MTLQPRFSAGRFDGELRRHGLEVPGDDLGGIRARRCPRDDAERVCEPCVGRDRRVEGHPDIGRRDRHLEARRHDADHRPRVLTDAQRSPNGIARAAKVALPKRVADHRRAAGGVPMAEPSSDRRRDAKRGEQVRRDAHYGNRLAAVELQHARPFVRPDLPQRGSAPAPVLVVGGRNGQKRNLTIVVA